MKKRNRTYLSSSHSQDGPRLVQAAGEGGGGQEHARQLSDLSMGQTGHRAFVLSTDGGKATIGHGVGGKDRVELGLFASRSVGAKRRVEGKEWFPMGHV